MLRGLSCLGRAIETSCITGQTSRPCSMYRRTFGSGWAVAKTVSLAQSSVLYLVWAELHAFVGLVARDGTATPALSVDSSPGLLVAIYELSGSEDFRNHAAGVRKRSSGWMTVMSDGEASLLILCGWWEGSCFEAVSLARPRLFILSLQGVLCMSLSHNPSGTTSTNINLRVRKALSCRRRLYLSR